MEFTPRFEAFHQAREREPRTPESFPFTLVQGPETPAVSENPFLGQTSRLLKK